MTQTEAFPTDWNEWRNQWKAWQSEPHPWKQSRGKDVPRTLDVHPNFLANEILGYWKLHDGPWVELSEVTMPRGLTGDRVRYIGITYANENERWTPDKKGIVGSFAELEAELFGGKDNQ